LKNQPRNVAYPSCLFVFFYWSVTLFSSKTFLIMLFTILLISFWNYLFKLCFILRTHLESSSEIKQVSKGHFFAFNSKGIQFPCYFWKAGKKWVDKDQSISRTFNSRPARAKAGLYIHMWPYVCMYVCMSVCPRQVFFAYNHEWMIGYWWYLHTLMILIRCWSWPKVKVTRSRVKFKYAILYKKVIDYISSTND